MLLSERSLYKFIMKPYTNINKLVMQIKDLSWSQRIGIAFTLFLWMACISAGIAIGPIIIALVL